MWIERVEFIGFGNITGQRLDFSRKKLSLILQPNDYGKSTIAEAIWAVVHDYGDEATDGAPGRRAARQPLSGAAYKACLDVLLADRRVRLIRDFSQRSIKVLDLNKDPSKADADVTRDFGPILAAGKLGEAITGLDRELFRTICLVGQRQLDAAPFARNRALASLLSGEVGEGGVGSNAFDAIAVIEERLAQFPYKGKPYDIDELVAALAEQRDKMSADLRSIEASRQECDRDVERLSKTEEQIASYTRLTNAEDYFQLCLDLADIETRVARAQERSQRITELKQQVMILMPYAAFPKDQQPAVEELWSRRQSRRLQLLRLEAELKEQGLQEQLSELENRERHEELRDFSLDDAQMLGALSRDLEQVEAELVDVRGRCDAECKRIAAAGLNIQALDGLRRSLLVLEQKELDELHSIHAMLVGARDRTNECLMSADRAHNTALEIIESRRLLIDLTKKFFWPLLGAGGVSLLPIVFLLGVQHRALDDTPVSVVLLLWAIFCTGAAACRVVSDRISKSYRVVDENLARLEEHKYSVSADELAEKVHSLESRIEALAAKANLSSGSELIRNMQEYALCATQFKELDFLEYVLKNSQAHADKLRHEIAPFFRQAGRKPAASIIAAEESMRLSHDISRFLETSRAYAPAADPLNFRQSEIRFLTDEMKDDERLLMDAFTRMGLAVASVDEGYAVFSRGAENFARWEAISQELEGLTEDSGLEVFPSELHKQLERLELRRADIWTRMQELMAANPDIAAMTPPTADGRFAAPGADMNEVRASLQELRGQRDELTVQIRAIMKNYQDNYRRALEQLETVEQHLERVRHTRGALRLARDTFLRLAVENHAVWADRLNDLTRSMLKQVLSDYEALEFDAELNLTVRRKGHKESMRNWQMVEQISAGTREQLYLLARLAVLQLLSGKRQLPIILDEPFSEVDDQRFLKLVRFLLSGTGEGTQIILLSCQRQRYQWLLEQLAVGEREQIEACQLEALKADAAVRR